MKDAIYLGVLAALASVLSGCASSHPAPVTGRWNAGPGTIATFGSNGSMTLVGSKPAACFDSYPLQTWSASGDQLHLTSRGKTADYSYSVSKDGKSLTVTAPGGRNSWSLTRL